MSSDKVQVTSDLQISRKLLRPYTGEYYATYEYDYYRINTRDGGKYKIDSDEYKRITKAMNEGVKFIVLNGDLVNINFIDKIEKKIGYK